MDSYQGGLFYMKGIEAELFNTIYEYDDPEEAVLIAIKVFSAFLEQLAEAPQPQPGGLQESAGIN